MNTPKPYHAESGVALIMVLGMVAIIAAWAATATYEDMVSIQRISNIQDETRATMASESAYALTQIVLKEEYLVSNDPPIDSLDEEWAQELPPFPVDEGLIAVTLEDANRYYNLNDLVGSNGQPQDLHVKQVQRLFTLLELDRALVDALVDWMDKDNLPYGVGGAEDSAYYSKDYKVKNNHLDNWSELKLIHGFTHDVLKKLKTVAVVRPPSANEKTLININTAAPFVLMALFPQMTPLDEETFFDERPYDDKNIINSQTWREGGDVSRLSVSSDVFMLRTHAMFGRANVREEYLLSRKGTQIKLLSRERLGWQF